MTYKSSMSKIISVKMPTKSKFLDLHLYPGLPTCSKAAKGRTIIVWADHPTIAFAARLADCLVTVQ
jgi:hypothetical protein